jgi:hypothetical protein
MMILEEGSMSVTHLETRNVRTGHEVLRTGVVICYMNGRQFGKAVQEGLRHCCPSCGDQVYTYAS